MTRATSLAWMLMVAGAAAGCAGTATVTKPQAATSPPPPRAATLSVELDVEDITRKEPWLQTALEDELAGRGITVRHARVDGGYVVHVRVESRTADRGVARAKPSAPKGSTRLDGAIDEQQQEQYRDTPAPETRLYSAPTRPGQPAPPTQTSDDFRIAANATLTRSGSQATISTSEFDDRALGITPIAPGHRGDEWKTVYRAVAMHVAKWLESQHLQ